MFVHVSFTLNINTYTVKCMMWYLIHSCNPPCVPYLGMYLTDLAFIEEGTPNFTEEGLVNFSKMRMVKCSNYSRCCQDFHMLQSSVKSCAFVVLHRSHTLYERSDSFSRRPTGQKCKPRYSLDVQRDLMEAVHTKLLLAH